MRPNYLVIGAQKCATSSLCHLIGQHPDVFMTDPKEPYFFSNEDVWTRGWQWYESLFAAAAGKIAIGEGSTTYTQNGLHPAAPQRIAEHLPDAKLIYIVRDPLDRIVSHYLHLRSKGGQEQASFSVAVRRKPQYIDNSQYLHQIELYRQHFPDRQIHVDFFEDLKSAPDAVLRRCLGFLGVDPDRMSDADWRPQHVSAEGRVDTGLLRLARHIPLFGAASRALPEAITAVLRRGLKTPVEQRPQWDNETRAWALSQLAEPSREFLKQYGKGEDFWRLD